MNGYDPDIPVLICSFDRPVVAINRLLISSLRPRVHISIRYEPDFLFH
ncbi:hypothetical protein OHAE_2981 [Ochrobactrum soli]|uniref:Uncharacterized protein n=1 Tax=Ochrobactrum soli TaxID=2448455 RepID=A0A2P9HG49_9HYPH|nr:hypothetical protein OHAE_2981 [[Ochrobactrum] soli]